MINRKFSGPLGRATKFSHPRATMSVIVVIFTAANKFTAFCAIRLLDFRPTDHRRQQNIGGVRVLAAFLKCSAKNKLSYPVRAEMFLILVYFVPDFSHSLQSRGRPPGLARAYS